MVDGDRRWTPRALLIAQTLQTLLDEPPPPLADRVRLTARPLATSLFVRPSAAASTIWPASPTPAPSTLAAPISSTAHAPPASRPAPLSRSRGRAVSGALAGLLPARADARVLRATWFDDQLGRQKGRTRDVKDRLDVAETLARYGHVADHGVLDRLDTVFTADAVYDMSAVGLQLGAQNPVTTSRTSRSSAREATRPKWCRRD